MDTNALVAHARARFDHVAAKRILREKYEAKMIFGYRGGLWRAGPALQTTLMTCPGAEAVILDLYENPVKIDTKELFAQSQQRWQEQMNAWLVEHSDLSNKR